MVVGYDASMSVFGAASWLNIVHQPKVTGVLWLGTAGLEYD